MLHQPINRPPPPGLPPDVEAAPRMLASCPGFHWMYAHWRSKCSAGRDVPAKRRLSPAELRSDLLPNIMLVDVGDGGDRLRFRLMGTHLTEVIGQDFTGRTFDEIYGQTGWLPYIQSLYRLMIQRRRPVYVINSIKSDYFAGGQPRRFHRLMLPYATKGKTIDLCLSLQHFEAEPGWYNRSTERDEGPQRLEEVSCIVL